MARLRIRSIRTPKAFAFGLNGKRQHIGGLFAASFDLGADAVKFQKGANVVEPGAWIVAAEQKRVLV